MQIFYIDSENISGKFLINKYIKKTKTFEYLNLFNLCTLTILQEKERRFYTHILTFCMLHIDIEIMNT